MRPIIYSKRIKSLIKEEFDKIITEVFDKEVPTEYIILKTKIDVFDAITYRFKSNSNTSYDLEFLFTYVRGREIMDDKSLLYQHIKDLKSNETLDSIDIAFTLSKRVEGGKYITHDDYTKNSELNEPIEVMGRIQFLIKEFIRNNEQIKIYVVGRNTQSGKLSIYKKLFNNIFSNQSTLIEGNHFGYLEGAMYFINKKIFV